MDNFTEQLVKKQETSADRTRRIMLVITGVFVTILLALLSFIQLDHPILAFLGMVLAAASGYGTYFIVQSTYVEYEYTFTNGELEIAKIIAKKKRVELINTEVRSFTAFGKYDDGMEETEDMTVVMTSDNIASHEYYADFQHEDYGLTRLVFVPNEKMLEYIGRYLPAKLRNQ
jgi:hypothetical protein